MNLCETEPQWRIEGLRQKAEAQRREEAGSVCESLLADPEEGCGAVGDMKGLLAPNDCAAC